MTKKLMKAIAVLLAALVLLSALPLTATAAETEQSVGAISGTTGDCKWSLKNGVLTISGSGRMADYSGSVPWSNDFDTLIINNGVTYIGKKAFNECWVSSVTIPDSVTEIGECAFADCFELDSVYIPLSVTKIGSFALGYLYDDEYGYYAKHSFIVMGKRGSEAEKYAERNGFYFKENESDPLSGKVGDCVWIQDADGTLTISGNGELGSFIEYVDMGTAIRCPWLDSKVKKVVIRQGVTAINDYAFFAHYQLESVVIPDTVTYIGKSAFYNCSSLTDIEISNGVQRIGERAFYGCDNLSDIAVPDSVICVGFDAFEDTKWIDDQPDGFVCAGKVLYEYKGSCPNDIVIPNGIISISSYALSKDNITNITIPDSVIYIGNRAFSRTIWYDSQPDGIVYAGKVAYDYKGELTDCTSFELRSDTLGVAEYAFAYCSELVDVSFPDGLKTIGEYAFLDCEEFVEAEIPDSVIYIGQRSLGYVYDIDYGFEWDDDDHYCYYGFTIYGTPGTAAEDYAHKYHCAFIAVGTTGACEWVLRNGVLTVSGNGAMADIDDYDYHPETETYTYYQPWGKGIERVIIEEGVTRIGAASFHYCKSLTSASLPASLTEIGEKAFNGCSAMTEISVPGRVTDIGTSAFRGCNGLETVTIGNGVTTIGDTAFYYCKNLKSVTIPESVTNIGEMAFGYLSATKKVEGFTIHGKSGSAAERYANENGFAFVSDGQAILKGDVNLDGSVDIKDVTEIQSALAEYKTLTAEQIYAADVDGNGNVTVADATRLQMYLAEFDVELG